MNQPKRRIARSIAAVGATLVLVGGATFAALQSQAGVLRGNTIQTAVASLQVSNTGTNFSNTVDGYAFGNLVPGGQPSPLSGYPVYVKNVGTAPLALRLSISPTLVNGDNVNLSKVKVYVTPAAGGQAQTFTMQELVTAHAAGGVPITTASRINTEQVLQYLLQVSLDADAVNGPSATLSNVDFNFGAIAVN